MPIAQRYRRLVNLNHSSKVFVCTSSFLLLSMGLEGVSASGRKFNSMRNVLLVLSRKVGEQLRIGDGITVKVLKVCGNRIRLGIDAPDGVRIMRGELPSCGSAMSPATGTRTGSTRTGTVSGYRDVPLAEVSPPASSGWKAR